jgi:hypothetical protein
MHRFAAGSRQIAGKRAPTPCGQKRDKPRSYALQAEAGSSETPEGDLTVCRLPLILAGGRGSKLARDLPRSGSKVRRLGIP